MGLHELTAALAVRRSFVYIQDRVANRGEMYPIKCEQENAMKNELIIKTMICPRARSRRVVANRIFIGAVRSLHWRSPSRRLDLTPSGLSCTICRQVASHHDTRFVNWRSARPMSTRTGFRTEFEFDRERSSVRRAHLDGDMTRRRLSDCRQVDTQVGMRPGRQAPRTLLLSTGNHSATSIYL